jgi:hypothetical protein
MVDVPSRMSGFTLIEEWAITLVEPLPSLACEVRIHSLAWKLFEPLALRVKKTVGL